MAQFEKGKSGNPAGRPRRDGTRKDLRQAITDRADDIINRLIASAIDGDTQAARVLLDRVLPAWKAQDPPDLLPPGIDISNLSDAPGAVLKALTDGGLDIGKARGITAVLSGMVRVVEIAELESRVSRLEDRTNGTKS